MSYMLFVLPAMLLGMWAQWKVKSAYARTSQVPSNAGISGRQTAEAILQQYGITHVGIEESPGKMSDHYDPRSKMLRLSPEVYHGTSLASLGIAAHEVGHALQDHQSYGPLKLRNGIVPLANSGSNLGIMAIMGGGMAGFPALIYIGVGLFSLTVLFQLINLPVEFNASSRAKKILLEQGIINQAEHKEVDGVLDAAALTYVAATVSAISTLLYYLSAARGGSR